MHSDTREDSTPDFVAMGAALSSELIALRRELHQIPELAFELPRTQARLLAALKGLPLEIHPLDGVSGFWATLRGGRPGPTVLLRADMDALPVTEQSGESFASSNGAMHACGHDLHMSGMVGAVKILSQLREQIAGTVLFMFQPNEETPAGARLMLEQGLLDATGERPVVAWGLHEMPYPAGTVHISQGAQMASNCQFTATFTGSGGHGSAPHAAIDPVPAVLDLGQQLQNLVTREFSVFDPVVCTVTQLRAGEAINVIHDTASLGATVRAVSREATERFARRSVELARAVAAAHRCEVEAGFRVNCPTTINDPRAARIAAATAQELFGAERVVGMEHPVMASEDFSYVLEQVPGAFFFFGALPEGVDPAGAPQLHSPLARYNDAVLGDQAALLAALAFKGASSQRDFEGASSQGGFEGALSQRDED
ncbi:hippurate hydrolase [Propionibacterium cyclohexanicum]|uniref:Hippurate hydrolase n=1 Tax=Propionibacterium cyclohexanicum TaxID=64702 RepID=A0A1H9RF41_9ACTN|nr:M20 family metallopeptidase [Propionibacterium cyclohexanicum]SER71175.1 hippurate hydrolase [Propionibacterium cyclohexanicum]